MTDNEIKCEKCFHKTVCEKKTCVECNGSYCDECEIYNIYDGKPKIESCESFVDAELINRQQAEIERLTKHIINLKCEKERQKAEIEQMQSDLTIEKQANDHAKEVLERLQKTTHRATQRAMKAHKELQAAKAENERLHTEAISDVLKKLLSLEDVYAKVEGEFVEWDPCVELEYLFPREFEQAYSTEEEGDPE